MNRFLDSAIVSTWSLPIKNVLDLRPTCFLFDAPLKDNSRRRRQWQCQDFLRCCKFEHELLGRAVRSRGHHQKNTAGVQLHFGRAQATNTKMSLSVCQQQCKKIFPAHPSWQVHVFRSKRACWRAVVSSHFCLNLLNLPIIHPFIRMTPDADSMATRGLQMRRRLCLPQQKNQLTRRSTKTNFYDSATILFTSL